MSSAKRTLSSISLLLLLVVPAMAKEKKGDQIWVSPEFRSRAIESIAVLPVAAFDNNIRNEKLVEALFAQALRPSGYRWVTPTVAKELIRTSAGGDAELVALDQMVLKRGAVDSTAAARICRIVHTQALMTCRIDLFDRTEVEWNQSGKPTTTVQVRAALVDSTGKLLWNASGSETGEGAYHEAGAGMVGVKMSSGTTPMTGEAGAPSYEDVTTRLFARWMKNFPARATAAAPSAPASGSAPSPAAAARDSTH